MSLEDRVIKLLEKRSQKIGDDATVLRVGKAGSYRVVSKDLLVEGTHFDRKYFREQDIGAKAVAVNVSDIAAMGSIPRRIWVGLGIPDGVTEAEIRRFSRGIERECLRYDVELCGGDTVRSAVWVVSVTIEGESPWKPVSRHGVKPGDVLLLTGYPGLSESGRNVLEKNPSARRRIDSRIHLCPTVFPRFAAYLARKGLVRTMMDVSDGLALDVPKFLERSGCGMTIDLRGIIVHPLIEKQRDAIERFFLCGGEDYGLLMSVREREVPVVKKQAARRGIFIQELGKVRRGNELLLIDEKGTEKRLERKGFLHFEQGD